MGGYPNYTLLTKTAGIKTGFVGKISHALLNNRTTLWRKVLYICVMICPY